VKRWLMRMLLQIQQQDWLLLLLLLLGPVPASPLGGLPC
jgi:hypothetical protein